MSPFVWKLGFRFIFDNGGVGILDELGIDFSSFFPWDHCRYGYISAYFLNKSIVYGQTLEFLELIYDWVFSNFYALRRLPRSETIKEFNDVLKLMETKCVEPSSENFFRDCLHEVLVYLCLIGVGYWLWTGVDSGAGSIAPQGAPLEMPVDRESFDSIETIWFDLKVMELERTGIDPTSEEFIQAVEELRKN